MNHESTPTAPARIAALTLTTLALAALAACSSSESTPTPDAGPAGGPIDAALVDRCAATDDAGAHVVTVDPAACTATEADAGHQHGEVDAGHEEVSEYGDTLFGQSGADDDCKYHLVFSTTPVRQNEDVTITLTVTNLADGTAATGADAMTEIFLSETHPAPNTAVTTTEDPPGTYRISPIRFDAAGDWTVRFHLNDQCTDSETSPHGHGAFFVRVP